MDGNQAMISITRTIAIDEKEIAFHFITASGPGGQHVNKVATAVQLRFDVRNCPSLTDDIRQRLRNLAGKKLTQGGMLIIEAKRFRSQERNRQDAVDRLIALVRRAAKRPRPRKKTCPSKASVERKRTAKRYRSRIKQMRRAVQAYDE